MTSFATSDYEFLIKCLVQGSISFKSQSLKRLTILAPSDKKLFASNVRKILLNLQQLLTQQKEDINVLSTLLLLEIIPHVINKQVDQLLKNKLIKLIVRNLGDVNNPTLRKCSHSCLLSYIKTYHSFDNILHHYLKEGLTSHSWQLQQKCINSFQSILIMQVKHMNWASYQLKKMFEILLQKLKDQNNYVNKAAHQCIGSLNKMPNVKIVIENLSIQHLNMLKEFINSENQTYPQINDQYMTQLIKIKSQNGNKKVKVNLNNVKKNQEPVQQVQPIKIQNKNEIIQPQLKQQNPSDNRYQQQDTPDLTKKQNRNPQKTKKNIKYPQITQRKIQIQQTTEFQLMANIFNKKLLENLKNQNNGKQRIQAAQQILCKIEINKQKPQIASFLRHILPSVIKLITDQNFKLVLTGLKIIQNMIDSSQFQLKQEFIPILVQRISDSKTSIRQNVLKIIKNLMKKMNKDPWIEAFLNILKNNPNQYFKDEIFTLIQSIYEQSSGQINYDFDKIIQALAPFMQDPKTKIKIKTLDCLVMIAIKSNKIEQTTQKLYTLLSAVFYEMFVQKVSKHKKNTDRKMKINKIHLAVSQSISSASMPQSSLERTIHLEEKIKQKKFQKKQDLKQFLQRSYYEKKDLKKNPFTPQINKSTNKSQAKFNSTSENNENLQQQKKYYETLDVHDLKLNQSIQVARKGLLNIHKKNRKYSNNRQKNQLQMNFIKKDTISRQLNQDTELFLPVLAKNKYVPPIKDMKTKLDGLRTIQLTPKSERQNQQLNLSKSKETTGILDYKASQYLLKQQLKILPEAEKQYKNILNILRDPDWHHQFEGINKLRRVIQHSEQALSYGGNSHLHLIVIQLLKLVQNLRSSVSKNAMICLGQLIERLKKLLDPQIQIIIEKLFKKTADSNIFINQEIKKCLSIISVNLTDHKVLQYLTQYKESKIFSVKQNIMNMLLKMIETEKILKKQYPKIIQILVYFLGEAHVELRNKSKNTILQFCKALQDWQRLLRTSVSAEIYKAVLQIWNKNENKSNMSSNTQLLKTLQRKSSIQKSQKIQRSLQKKMSNISQQKKQTPSLSEGKKKSIKVINFPQQFLLLDQYYLNSSHQDWKKRIDSLKDILEIIKKYPNQFCQYRSSSKFIDILSARILQPNAKVSIYSTQIFIQNFDILKPLIQNNLNILTNSIFNNLSSSKIEIKQETQKLYQLIYNNIDINLLLQHICHGCLYSLPKSRTYLLNKLSKFVIPLYQNKNALFMKYVIPMLNKTLQENKTQIMPYINEVIKEIYICMGEQMYNLFNKSNLLREMLSRI